MSLSNKELLDKTLFLKDSVLFISIDGKEYEVSNPEEVDFLIHDRELDIWWRKRFNTEGEPIEFTEQNKIEWPGGVELIELERLPPILKARLLPKEKKEPKPKVYKKVKTIDIPEIDQIMSSTPDEVRKYIKEKLNKVARVMTEDCTYEEAERNWQNDNSPLSFIEYLKKYYTITRKPE